MYMYMYFHDICTDLDPLSDVCGKRDGSRQ